MGESGWSILLARQNRDWKRVETLEDGLRKRPGMQGPIDDAFMDRFVIVKPTGTAMNEKVGKWANEECEHAILHWHKQFRLYLLPAPCGHHLNPIEGFWRVMKDRIGAGRCWPDLHQLYQRTRRVLTDHQARPIYEFHW